MPPSRGEMASRGRSSVAELATEKPRSPVWVGDPARKAGVGVLPLGCWGL